MCNKGNPSTTQNSSTNSMSNQSGTSNSSIGPTPDTLSLYQNFLNSTSGVASTPFNPATQTSPLLYTDAQQSAYDKMFARGMEGPDPRYTDAAYGAANMALGTNPYGPQAAQYGVQQGAGISNYATNLAASGPQLEQFSKGAIDKYMSPYIQDVVNTTQKQFNNQNAIQGNSLIGQAIRSGNAFGGDRAGIAEAQLAGQQQTAQAPVIAGLYNSGYNTALGEFNTNNALAAQLGQMAINGQVAGAQTGLAGLGLGANTYASDANRYLSAANSFSNMGNANYMAGLAGSNAAVQGAAGLPNAVAANNNIATSNAMMQSAYPFQTSGWLAQILGGIGPLTGSSQSGTSTQAGTQVGSGTGQTTPPQPNGFTQALGLAASAIPFFIKDGGSVPRRAVGGGLGGETPFSGAPYSTIHVPEGVSAVRSYVPSFNLPRGSLMTPTVNASLQALAPLKMVTPDSPKDAGTTGSFMGDMTKMLSNKDTRQNISALGNKIFGQNDGNSFASGTSVAADSFAHGGFTGNLYDDDDERNVRHYLGGVPEMDGGIVRPGSDAQHFDDGGDVDDQTPFQVAELRPTKATWFYTEPGGYRGDNGLWNDVQGAREGKPASGMPSQVPGIATPNRRTMGDYFRVVGPNGREEIAQQTDHGPGPGPVSRGIGLDVNAPLADAMGYAPQNFPSGGQFKVEHLGAEPPTGYEPTGIPQQAGEVPQLDGRGGVYNPNGMGNGMGAGPGPAGERIPFPGGQPAAKTGLAGALERWANHPLTAIGLGIASGNSANFMSNIAHGLQVGAGAINKQTKEAKLDAKPELTSLGGEMVWKMANGDMIRTGMPSTAGMTDARQREATEENANQRRDANANTVEERRERSKAIGEDKAERQKLDLEAKKERQQRDLDAKEATRAAKGEEELRTKRQRIDYITNGYIQSGMDPDEARKKAQQTLDAESGTRLPRSGPLEPGAGVPNMTPGMPGQPAVPGAAPQAPRAPKVPTGPEVRKQLKDGTVTFQQIQEQARAAVAKGHSPAGIIAKLKEMGLNPGDVFQQPQVPMSQ